MKRILLFFLIFHTLALLSAIVVETASLKNFLFGSESGSQYDNWVSHLAEGIANLGYNTYAPYDVQKNGFGSFKIPENADLTGWNSMLDQFVAGNYNAAQTILDNMNAPFQIVEFHDTDSGLTYYMIRELPDFVNYFDDNGTPALNDDEHGAFTYGWGLFIYNPEAESPVIITVPHPCDDFPTTMLSYYAFSTWNAQFLMINGAGREVKWTNVGSYDNSKSLSDPSRNANHPFHQAYIKFANQIRTETGKQEFSPQIHSYDWNRHSGYANCQISAGNPRPCPNLPIRDLSDLKHDLINAGNLVMVPANSVGSHPDVGLNSFYAVNYTLYNFTFLQGENSYTVNNSVNLPAYSQNRQMLYTQSGTTDYDVYDPFFHIEMDELPNVYGSSEAVYLWFYGWDELNQFWDMDNLFTNFVSYYGRWVDDMTGVLAEMFQMNDGVNPTNPTNLRALKQTSTSAKLDWNRSSAYDFESYQILYANEPIGTANYLIIDRISIPLLASQAGESITITGLTVDLPYYFRLRAKDKNGNYSDLSNEVFINVQIPAPVFGVTPLAHDFGLVVAGTPASQEFNLSNSGTGTLRINSVSLTGMGAVQFVLSDDNSYPVNLGAGQSIRVKVNFVPQAEGSFSALLLISDNLTRTDHQVNISAICTDTPNHGGGDVSTTAGGYYFANNLSVTAPSRPQYNWITETSAEVNPNQVSQTLDNGYWGPVPLGLSFAYYGNTYQQLYIGTNGFVTFGSGSSRATNVSVPTSQAPNNLISLFWDDLEYFEGQSHIYYGGNASAFTVTFTRLSISGRTYDPNYSLTAQVTFYADGNIKFQYQDVKGSHTPTIGLENSSGTKGIQYHLSGNGALYRLSESEAGIAIMFGTNEQTLPVELSAFTAIATSYNFVQLEWTTQSETNLTGFYLYRNTYNDLNTALRIQSLFTASNTSQEAYYAFIDREINTGNTYYYWLECLELTNESEFHGPISIHIVGADTPPPAIPDVTLLRDAYPNPFSPSSGTRINYSVKSAGNGKIEIFNIKGQIVRTANFNHDKAGNYSLGWDGNDVNGKSLTTGIYYCRMTSGKFTSSLKITLMK